MPARKARALQTRQRILASAAEVFAEKGFGAASLHDVAERAYVTTGAFYHHFDSKDAVASALVEDNWHHVLAGIQAILDTRAPGLENVIVTTFALIDGLSSDRSSWLAYDLDYRFGQAGREGQLSYSDRVGIVAGLFTSALERTELYEDTTAEEAGAVIVHTLYGLVTTALHDSARTAGADPGGPVRQLADNWQVLLRGIAPAGELPYYRQFLTRTAAVYDQRVAAV